MSKPFQHLLPSHYKWLEKLMVQQILPSCIYNTEHPWEVMDNIKICMYLPISMCIKNELPNSRFSMQILRFNKREVVQLPHQKIAPPLFVHQEWGPSG